MDYIHIFFAIFHILLECNFNCSFILYLVHNFVTCEIVLLFSLGILLVVYAKFVERNKRDVCITLQMIVIICRTVY